MAAGDLVLDRVSTWWLLDPEGHGRVPPVGRCTGATPEPDEGELPDSTMKRLVAELYAQ